MPIDGPYFELLLCVRATKLAIVIVCVHISTYTWNERGDHKNIKKGIEHKKERRKRKKRKCQQI